MNQTTYLQRRCARRSRPRLRILSNNAARGRHLWPQPACLQPCHWRGDQNTVALASTEEVDTPPLPLQKPLGPHGPKRPPLRRARILDRFKMILWDRADQLAEAISLEHGKTHDDAVGEVTRGLEVVEFAVGAPHLLKGEITEQVGTGVDAHTIRQSLRRCCRYHTVQLPCDGTDVDVPGCSGRR